MSSILEKIQALREKALAKKPSFEVGDRVRLLRPNKPDFEKYHPIHAPLIGQVGTARVIHSNGMISIEAGRGCYAWWPDALELVEPAECVSLKEEKTAPVSTGPGPRTALGGMDASGFVEAVRARSLPRPGDWVRIVPSSDLIRHGREKFAGLEFRVEASHEAGRHPKFGPALPVAVVDGVGSLGRMTVHDACVERLDPYARHRKDLAERGIEQEGCRIGVPTPAAIQVDDQWEA